MSNEIALAEEDMDAADNPLADALRDPSKLGYPPMLPVELAMRLDSPANICKVYNITKAQFGDIIKHPVFLKAYQEAVESLKVEGMSFKLKARMQAEDYLTTAYAMVKSPNTSDAVRADLLKSTVRWAGYDQKATDIGQNNAFNIMINLG